jgi:hypothetical protein
MLSKVPARMAGIDCGLILSSSPSRAGVEGCPDARAYAQRIRIETPPVSWLGGLSRQRRNSSAAFPSPHRIGKDSMTGSVARTDNLLRLTVARRRRHFTVFPCAESRVIVDGALCWTERRLRKSEALSRGRRTKLLSDSLAESRADVLRAVFRLREAPRKHRRAGRARKPRQARPRASTCPCAAARCGRKIPPRDSARG